MDLCGRRRPRGGPARRLRRLAGLVAGFAYPPRCVVAGCRVAGCWLCPACLDRIVPLPESRCPRCAGCLRAGHCAACRTFLPPFFRVVAVGPYVGVLRDAVHALKYRGVRGVAVPLAHLVAERAPPFERSALVVAVPAHARKRASRWVDHASLLAAEIGVDLGLEVARGLLVRTRATAPQVGLGTAARRVNVSGAFAAREDVRRRKVLLVDDVMTTGATAAEASAALLEAGATAVAVAVVARADHGHPGPVAGRPRPPYN